MSDAMILAIINLVIRIGLPAASILIERLNKPSASIDDAIEALKLAAAKSAQDYLDEAKKATTT